VRCGLFRNNPSHQGDAQLRVIYTPQNPPRSYVPNNLTSSNAAHPPHLSDRLLGSHGSINLSTNDLNNVRLLWAKTLQATYLARPQQGDRCRTLPALAVNNPAWNRVRHLTTGQLISILPTSLASSAPQRVTGKIAVHWSTQSTTALRSFRWQALGNSVIWPPPPAISVWIARTPTSTLRNVCLCQCGRSTSPRKRGGAYTSLLHTGTFNNIFHDSVRHSLYAGDLGDPLGGLARSHWLSDRTVSTRSCTNGHKLTTSIPPASRFPGRTPTLHALPDHVSHRSSAHAHGPAFFFWTTDS